MLVFVTVGMECESPLFARTLGGTRRKCLQTGDLAIVVASLSGLQPHETLNQQSPTKV